MIEGYEAMHAIRKAEIRWVPKGDPLERSASIHPHDLRRRRLVLAGHDPVATQLALLATEPTHRLTSEECNAWDDGP
jgi:hypothetical protein